MRWIISINDLLRLDTEPAVTYSLPHFFGAIAQLGERLNGIQEVGGSIPPSSTKIKGLRNLA